MNGVTVASLRSDDPNLTSGAIARIWSEELLDVSWKCVYWVTDSVNYGSHRYIFDTRGSEAYALLEEAGGEFYLDDAETICDIEVTRENVEKVRKALELVGVAQVVEECEGVEYCHDIEGSEEVEVGKTVRFYF